MREAEYTGRIRYRQVTIKHWFFPNEKVLVLEVEKYYTSSTDHMCYPDRYTRWEDARVQDLTLMEPVDES